MHLAANSGKPADAPVEKTLQILLRFDEVAARQHEYLFFFIEADENFDTIEIRDAGLHATNLVALPVTDDDPEVTPKAEILILSAAVGIRPTRPPAALGRRAPLARRRWRATTQQSGGPDARWPMGRNSSA